MLIYLQMLQVDAAAAPAAAELLGYLTGAANGAGLKLSPAEWKLCNLSGDWLQTLLPHCLQKVNRVTFGVMRQAEVMAALQRDPLMSRSRTQLAIPFVGKDVPSRAAEFAQPDVCIGLTLLAYSLEGLRPMDLRDVVSQLQDEMHTQSGPMKQREASRLCMPISGSQTLDKQTLA